MHIRMCKKTSDHARFLKKFEFLSRTKFQMFKNLRLYFLIYEKKNYFHKSEASCENMIRAREEQLLKDDLRRMGETETLWWGILKV